MNHPARCGVSVIVLLLGFWLRATPAAAFSFGTTADAWDVSQGVVVTSDSGMTGASSSSDILGGNDASVETGTGLFRDDQAEGFVHFVEWQTPAPVLVSGFSLYANDDGSPSKDRGFTVFRLFAKNPNTAQFDQIGTFTAPANPYPDGNLEVHLAVTPITAQQFRAEFVQAAGTDTPARGPRIRELDVAIGFGDDDGGFVPPDKDAGKCEHKVAKLIATLFAKTAACVRKSAKAGFKSKPFDQAVCEAKALDKFNASGAKLHCPECIASAAANLHTVATDRVAEAEPAIYCAGTTPFGVLGGLVPPDKATAKCADGVAKSLIKLGLGQIACHTKMAKKAFARKPFDEEACEAKAQGKYDKAQAKRVDCPVCLDAGTIATTMRETLDDENSEIYCAF